MLPHARAAPPPTTHTTPTTPTGEACPGSLPLEQQLIIETINARLARVQVTIRRQTHTTCEVLEVAAATEKSGASPSLLAVCINQDASCSEVTSSDGASSLVNQACDRQYCRSTTSSSVEEMGFADRPLRRASGTGASLAISFSSTLSSHEDQPPYMKVTTHGNNPISFFNADPSFRKRHGCADYREGRELDKLGIVYNEETWIGFDDQLVLDPANSGLPVCVFNVSGGGGSSNPACDAHGLAKVRFSPFQCPEVVFENGAAVFRLAEISVRGIPDFVGWPSNVVVTPGLELVPDMARLNLGGSFSMTFTIRVTSGGNIMSTVATAQTDVDSVLGQAAFDGGGEKQRADIQDRFLAVQTVPGNGIQLQLGQDPTNQCTGPALVLNVWTHIAIRYSAEEKKCAVTVIPLDQLVLTPVTTTAADVERVPGGQDSLFLGSSLGGAVANRKDKNSFSGDIGDIMIYDEFITDEAAGYINGRQHQETSGYTSNFAMTHNNVALRPNLADCTAPQENGFAYWRETRECTDVERGERESGASCFKYYAGYVFTYFIYFTCP